MSSYLKKILVFVLIPAILLSIFFLFKYKDVPAPKLTNSYSLNEKLFEFENFHCDYLCVGSSMALNNANSDVIINGFSSNDYFNFASWGTKIADIYPFLKVYLNDFNPKVILLVSNAMDFGPKTENFQEGEVWYRILYPYKAITPIYYLMHLDLHYYFKYYELNKLTKYYDTINSSLKFDPYGGVELVTNYHPPLDTLNWNTKIEFDAIKEENYTYLDSTLRLLDSKKIKFIFVQSPIREGLIDKEYKVEIEKHIKRVDSIINNYNQTFIDATQRIWPDSLFFDYAHFNTSGAKIFTQYFIDKIKKNGKLNDMETAGR